MESGALCFGRSPGLSSHYLPLRPRLVYHWRRRCISGVSGHLPRYGNSLREEPHSYSFTRKDFRNEALQERCSASFIPQTCGKQGHRDSHRECYGCSTIEATLRRNNPVSTFVPFPLPALPAVFPQPLPPLVGRAHRLVVCLRTINPSDTGLLGQHAAAPRLAVDERPQRVEVGDVPMIRSPSHEPTSP